MIRIIDISVKCTKLYAYFGIPFAIGSLSITVTFAASTEDLYKTHKNLQEGKVSAREMVTYQPAVATIIVAIA